MIRPLLTVTLRNGTQVLAKPTKYGISAYTFANRTQATTRAAQVTDPNYTAFVCAIGRPFYVVIQPHTAGETEPRS